MCGLIFFLFHVTVVSQRYIFPRSLPCNANPLFLTLDSNVCRKANSVTESAVPAAIFLRPYNPLAPPERRAAVVQ